MRFDVVFTVTIKHLRGKKTLISSKVSIYDLTTKNRKSLIDSIIIILRYDMLDSLNLVLLPRLTRQQSWLRYRKIYQTLCSFILYHNLYCWFPAESPHLFEFGIPNNINAIELLCDTALILLNCSKIFHT